MFSAEGKMEASKPEDTETEGAEDQVDYGPWTARKRFRAEYVFWNHSQINNIHTSFSLLYFKLEMYYECVLEACYQC